MSGSYKIVDESDWERARHCRIFRNCTEPMFCVTFEINITNFLEKIRKRKLSFTLAMVYAVCRCANSIENFRYRFLNGKVVLYDKINTSFTYLNKETELFKVVSVPLTDSLEEYVRLAEKTADEQREYFTAPPANNIFQCSAIPWVTYTHISHTNSGNKENSSPLFDWGKYYKNGDRILMPVSVQAHHSFVDGIHIGKFADCLQNFLNEF
ncbi:MAG: chloramphenicol acetyltransferase [Oscillospiraceae bacterium]|nr:chloramphenicol acetyltransferase [Oscillospiraceae bacterium]